MNIGILKYVHNISLYRDSISIIKAFQLEIRYSLTFYIVTSFQSYKRFNFKFGIVYHYIS
jgi:hypothetical protein